MTWQWKLPKGWQPWNHQVRFFEQFKDRHQMAALWEMGTGKTELSINWAEYQLDNDRADIVLALAPLSALELTWMAALDRCGIPRCVNIAASPSRKRRIEALGAPARWFVCNYDSLTSLLPEMLKAWRGKRIVIIADESTQIKNPWAVRTKALCKLAALATHKAILTGTPLPQGPQDIFGQYEFLDDKIFGTHFVAFRNSWMRMGGFDGHEILGLRPGLEGEFNAKMYSCAQRITKMECMDIPPKAYETYEYELNADEKAAYVALKDAWVLEMENGNLTAANGAVAAMRLAQVCTGFVGATEDEGTLGKTFAKRSKLAALGEVLDNIGLTSKMLSERRIAGKAIIFCRWRENVSAVCHYLQTRGLTALPYHGDLGQAERSAAVRAYLDDDNVDAIVLTGAAGGMSLNLQAPFSKWVIYFSQGYSSMERQQSEDRAWRGKVEWKVTIIDLVAKGTIERSIIKALQSKQSIQQMLLQSPAAFATGRI